ncbi:MAG: hypothetical protein U1G07_21995 [Verrucomicrobiota bacterium]
MNWFPTGSILSFSVMLIVLPGGHAAEEEEPASIGRYISATQQAAIFRR